MTVRAVASQGASAAWAIERLAAMTAKAPVQAQAMVRLMSRNSLEAAISGETPSREKSRVKGCPTRIEAADTMAIQAVEMVAAQSCSPESGRMRAKVPMATKKTIIAALRM